MARTSSITTLSVMGIVGRALAVDEKMWCFFICHAFGAMQERELGVQACKALSTGSTKTDLLIYGSSIGYEKN